MPSRWLVAPERRLILSKVPILILLLDNSLYHEGCAQARDKATTYIVQWASGWLALDGAGGGSLRSTYIYFFMFFFLSLSCFLSLRKGSRVRGNWVQVNGRPGRFIHEPWVLGTLSFSPVLRRQAEISCTLFYYSLFSIPFFFFFWVIEIYIHNYGYVHRCTKCSENVSPRFPLFQIGITTVNHLRMNYENNFPNLLVVDLTSNDLST